jgi:hypothetical protein
MGSEKSGRNHFPSMNPVISQKRGRRKDLAKRWGQKYKKRNFFAYRLVFFPP